MVNRVQDEYYHSLKICSDRYLEMSKGLDVNKFVLVFKQGVEDRLPLMKLNRWLGYIQGVLISLGLTDVDTERNVTRSLFRTLDFKDSSPW